MVVVTLAGRLPIGVGASTEEVVDARLRIAGEGQPFLVYISDGIFAVLLPPACYRYPGASMCYGFDLFYCHWHALPQLLHLPHSHLQTPSTTQRQESQQSRRAAPESSV